jgi:hypothetical protein
VRHERARAMQNLPHAAHIVDTSIDNQDAKDALTVG